MPPEIVQSWAAWLAALVAGLAALGWLSKKLRAGMRRARDLADKIGVIHELAEYELNPNHGGSIKDRVAKIPDIERRLDDHLEQSRQRDAQTLALFEEHAGAIAHLAEALPIIARSTPDPTDTQEAS